MNTLSQENFIGKICNTAQIGGIETSVMDNGDARGTRIAWVNTGSGLRYKVILDRSMDIGDAFFNRHSIAWMSFLGVNPPQPLASRSVDWLSTFAGGLMTTCGLTHIGGPETDEYGERGLHGRISNSPANIQSIIQPEPISGKMDMSITGIVQEAKFFDTSLQLKRTISSRLGESWISIRDEITNFGNVSSPHMLLYHFNFGWPLVDEGTDLVWQGKLNLLDEKRDSPIFNEQRNYMKCPPPLDLHKGKGEAAAYFDIDAEDDICTVGISNTAKQLAISLRYRKSQLPWLTNWQNWAPGEYVTGIEPGTNPPIGQAKARKQNELVFIEPGETKYYEVKLEVLHQDEDIRSFLKK